MTRVAVAGTTSWGTTLAVLLARNGAEVALWARTEAEAQLLQSSRKTPRRPELTFPETLRATADDACFADADLIVIAVPSASLRANLQRIVPRLHTGAAVLSAVKGFEPESGLRVSELAVEAGVAADHVLALSGPNFASEIAAGLPAATVVAGTDGELTSLAQRLFSGPSLRVYTSDDLVGVELGGALKNVVAIACGLCDGLGYGANARAALITRALAEITRLGVAAGARPLTFLGLAGMGDLILSCQSDTSRNRRLGLALATGQSLEAAIASIDGVVEGAVTARAIPGLAAKHGVELPIGGSLHAVLYEGLAPKDAVGLLMGRASKPELDGL